MSDRYIIFYTELMNFYTRKITFRLAEFFLSQTIKVYQNIMDNTPPKGIVLFVLKKLIYNFIRVVYYHTHLLSKMLLV